MLPEELKYQNVLKITAAQRSKGRNDSAAFLGWFLESIFRLDEVTAEDSICDAHNDKGVDAIYVSEIDQKICIFQSKLVQRDDKTLGDVSLKEFVGTLNQFKTEENVNAILNGNANEDLKKLIRRISLQKLVSGGYTIVGYFVTNLARDHNADEFLKQNPDLVVYDKNAIARDFVDIEGASGVAASTKLGTFEGQFVQYDAADEARMYFFVCPAADLVKLEGIADQALFSKNVRLSLGNTAVNKDITSSIGDKSIHSKFPLFHNGITLIADKIEVDEDQSIVVTNYVVVNGAQSISTLYKNKDKLSPELRLPVRAIELLNRPELSNTITQFSNNQNAIKARDLRANHHIQTRLQAEFRKIFGKEIAYAIKRGDPVEAASIISNEFAGILLLAFDLHQPWACHQVYKIFDDDYATLFGRPEVNASRIVLIWHIDFLIEQACKNITNLAFGRYRLTRFFLLYVVSRIISATDSGRSMVADAATLLSNGDWYHRVNSAVQPILDSLIIDLNYEVENMGEAFDYKSELKSKEKVERLATELLKSYEKDVAKGKAKSFSELWADGP